MPQVTTVNAPSGAGFRHSSFSEEKLAPRVRTDPDSVYAGAVRLRQWLDCALGPHASSDARV